MFSAKGMDSAISGRGLSDIDRLSTIAYSPGKSRKKYKKLGSPGTAKLYRYLEVYHLTYREGTFRTVSITHQWK